MTDLDRVPALELLVRARVTRGELVSALEFATRSDRGAPRSPARYHYEYLIVVARKRSG